MKIHFNHSKRECGSATLVFTVLLMIMVMLLMANSQALIHLHREIKLLDQQQVKRWAPAPVYPATNSIAK